MATQRETNKDSGLSKNFCSVWAIFAVLGTILILAIGLLLLFKKDFTTPKIGMPKIGQQLDEKVNQAVTTQAGEENVTVTLSEEDLEKALNLDQNNFPLKNPKIKIYSEKIIISGKTGTSFLSLGVDVGLAPKVDQGKVKFEIVEIKSAGIVAPKQVSDKVNTELSSYLSGVSLLPSFTVTDLRLSTGFLAITGKKN